jgi:hypothetical protein
MKAMPTMQVEWLDKKQAAERLGLGLRRTLDLAHNKALKTEKVRDPVTHQWTVRFHAADIERYLELQAEYRLRELADVHFTRRRREKV